MGSRNVRRVYHRLLCYNAGFGLYFDVQSDEPVRAIKFTNNRGMTYDFAAFGSLPGNY